jgi:acyl-CoA thioester hydrolase
VDGYKFSTEIAVRFAETDSQGIAHNSSYLIWFEVARVEYLARYAGGYQAMRDRGLEAIVTESHIRYRTPARFDDRLTIHARCVDVRGARFRYEYVVERADGARVAEGWTGHAVVNAKTFAPTRVPEWLAKAIARAESAVAAESAP